MIVTADPVGDFNATSQILRYSALAREITVPRIPSVSSTILATANVMKTSHASPSGTERETMELAALEIARMTEEIEELREELAEERKRREEADSHLLSMEDKLLDVETEVREQLFEEMDSTMREELRRWKASWESERECAEELADRKVDILMRGVGGDEDKENSFADHDTLNENARLRKEIELLRRDMASHSPTRKAPLGHRWSKEDRGTRDMEQIMGGLKLSQGDDDVARVSSLAHQKSAMKTKAPPSPTKRIRKLTAKRWESAGEDVVDPMD